MRDAAPNFANRTLYHGDNLEFLRGMNSGTVQLIATDPPFKKNRDFHATPDSLARGARFTDRWRWDADVHDEWVDAIRNNWPGVWAVIEAARVASGQDTAAFLCWMGVRLMGMRRILRDDGSIYLHIDHTAHAYVKCLMDAVFGRRNFRNEIVWCYKSGGASPNRHFSRKHDTILFYTRSDAYQFNPQREKSYNRGLKPYRFAGVEEYQDEVGWYTLVGMKDYWVIDMVGRTSAERTGYPTQKPLALYRRIIRASSRPGDVVLDPFCGCATTPIVAEQENRRWVGMDIWENAYQLILDRLRQENLAAPEAEVSPGQQRLTFGDIHLNTAPPVRTDDDDIPVPNLKLRLRRGQEPWQRLTNWQIRAILCEAQLVGEGLVGCAGCGRTLEPEFMELDHILPKSENGEDNIINRILLCGPCHGRKSDWLTMRGLRDANLKAGWLKDRKLAEQMQAKALLRSTRIRDDWGTPECARLLDKAGAGGQDGIR